MQDMTAADFENHSPAELRHALAAATNELEAMRGERKGPTSASIFMSAEDRKIQVGGSHYNSHAIQPWDIILEYKLDFWEGNALKYLLRRKGDARKQDLEKARHYIDECLRQINAKAPPS